MDIFCGNRIWSCSALAQSPGSLCSECDTQVAQFVAWQFLQATLVELSQSTEFPCKPCIVCGESTRWRVCKDCVNTIGSLPDHNVLGF